MDIGNGSDSPTVTCMSQFFIGCGDHCTGTVNMNSGTFDLSQMYSWGQVILGYSTAHSVFNQNGGITLNNRATYLGDAANPTGTPGDANSSV